MPIGFLERADCACNAVMLNRWLTKFVLEGTRRTDGRPYPPDTIYALLCGLYCYIQSLFGEAVPNFLSRKNLAFRKLNAATDRHYRELRASGEDTEKKSAQPLTEEEVERLWSLGILGSDSPKALLNAVFFLNGVNFALRDSEHYGLKVSQITKMPNEDGYVYREYGSKNRSGGLQDFRVPNKRVPIYRCP